MKAIECVTRFLRSGNYYGPAKTSYTSYGVYEKPQDGYCFTSKSNARRILRKWKKESVESVPRGLILEPFKWLK